MQQFYEQLSKQCLKPKKKTFTEVKACKSIQFTEGSPEVERKSEHIRAQLKLSLIEHWN